MSLKDAHFHQITTVDGTTAGTPLADQFDTAIASDIVCMSKYNKCYFLYYWGTNAGTAGTETLTVIPCDDATPTNTTTAIPFNYKVITQPDTNAAWVYASTYATAAVVSGLVVIEVNAEDLPTVSGVKYEYVKLQSTELVNGAKLGGIIIIMDEPRYAEDVTDTVTA
jgi:hypothetical protein